jgi:hypothetical protein
MCVRESRQNIRGQPVCYTIEGARMEMRRDGYDSIWVIVDHLTKVAHFIPVKTTYIGARLAELYISQIVCLHGSPKKIVSDRGSQFTSRFWQKLHESMDTKFNFSLLIICRLMGR